MSEDESDPYDLNSGPDPVAFTAVAPEPSIDETSGGGENTDALIYVVGVDPGSLEHLTPHGRQAIREADMVVGFETVVDLVAGETDTDLLACDYTDETDALAESGRHVAADGQGMAVLMGDPNRSDYQFFGKVQRTVERPVQVIPGISSLQIAASRARTPMGDTRFVAFHKSGSLDAGLDRLAEAAGEHHLLILSRPFDWVSGDIAGFLLDSDAGVSLDALVLERLTHGDERITQTTLGGLRDPAGGSDPDSTPYSNPSVLAVRAPVDAAD